MIFFNLVDYGAKNAPNPPYYFLSEILQGKRKLNINQIIKLAKKFHVSPNTFIED